MWIEGHKRGLPTTDLQGLSPLHAYKAWASETFPELWDAFGWMLTTDFVVCLTAHIYLCFCAFLALSD